MAEAGFEPTVACPGLGTRPGLRTGRINFILQRNIVR